MKIMYVFLALLAGIASFDSIAGNELSSEQIRDKVRQGEILSLDSILQMNQARLQGRLLDLEVEQDHGEIIYEMEFILDNGHVLEFEIDARTGRILQQEMKD
ncbi:MAG: PepSY domain-containing protein [Gammaproteobacteria bacterium]|nr:PepSY domain-containing protein [Gammaproteobacteria bacterium]MBL6999091.1 PepSY domain-containing protein [Gammaproteobacteria bacterium]